MVAQPDRRCVPLEVESVSLHRSREAPRRRRPRKRAPWARIAAAARAARTAREPGSPIRPSEE